MFRFLWVIEMKFYDEYLANDVPDEKSYKENIIKILYDYFFHEDLIFVLTNNPNKISVTGDNVIVFLSGNESSIYPVYWSKVKLIFTDFWLPIMPNNIHHIPLGNNTRSSKGDFYDFGVSNSKKISEREIDICFMAAMHTNSFEREIVHNELKNFKNLSVHNYMYHAFYYADSERDATKNIYFEVLSNSKINICVGGNLKYLKKANYFAGYETYRHLESSMMSNIIITDVHWSPYHMSPSTFVIDDWKNFNESYVSNILNNYDLDDLQLKSINYYKESQSKLGQIKRMIGIIEQNI